MTDNFSSKEQAPIAGDLNGGTDLKTGVFTLACVTALVFGYAARDDYNLTPESGGGYALGIAGGIMMLLLLIYPLRKRFRFMGHIMKLKSWFRLHMLLGIVGPICILFHCNFSLGSTNSNMALVSMCVMVLSGLVGRYFYSRIHLGLYGEKASLQALQERRSFSINQLEHDREDADYPVNPEIFQRLLAFEAMAMEPRGVAGNLVRALAMGFHTRWTYFILLWKMRTNYPATAQALSRARSRQLKAEERRSIGLFLALVRKIAQLSFFERLFSLWHALHLPIFFMLVVTGFVHVYAVHSY